MESHPEQASSSQPLHPGDARWSLVLRCQTTVNNLAPFHAVAQGLFEKCQHTQPAVLLPAGQYNFSLKSARIPAEKLLASGPKFSPNYHFG